MRAPTRPLLALFIGLLIVCLSGCQKSDVSTDAHQPIQDVSIAAADADITAKVKLALMMRDGINSLTISIKTESGVVTLAGSVPSSSQSNLAQELAFAVDGVRRVNNHLFVVPAAL